MRADRPGCLRQADCRPGDLTVSDADADHNRSLTADELSALTVAQLKRIAGELGITLTATRKADIIAEILDGAESIEIPVEDGQDGPIEVEVPGG